LEVILTIELHRGFSKSKQIMSKLIFRVHRLYIVKTEKQTQFRKRYKIRENGRKKNIF
jgi:hypothetical protein